MEAPFWQVDEAAAAVSGQVTEITPPVKDEEPGCQMMTAADHISAERRRCMKNAKKMIGDFLCLTKPSTVAEIVEKWQKEVEPVSGADTWGKFISICKSAHIEIEEGHVSTKRERVSSQTVGMATRSKTKRARVDEEDPKVKIPTAKIIGYHQLVDRVSSTRMR